MFPDFADSRVIMLKDKEEIQTALKKMNIVTSDLNFTNMYIWGIVKGYRISSFKGHIIVFMEIDGSRRIFCPIGNEPETLIEELANDKDVFIRIPENIAKKIDNQHLNIKENRNDFDYVYEKEKLQKLEGAKLYPKRSLAEKCMNMYSPEIIEHPQVKPGECLKLQNEWIESKGDSVSSGIIEEMEALRALIENREEFDISCLAIRIQGSIAAFTVGEYLNDDTFVIHFEKANHEYKGIYQLINREFARRIPDGVRFVNREQDLGIPGLRKAKKSYQPVRLEKKFDIRKKI